MEDWKNKIRDVLNRHREKTLSNCRSVLETFPAMTTGDVEMEYCQKLHNLICDQWSEFLISSQKEVLFKGNLEDFPQNDPSFLGEFWQIQLEIDKVYGNRFSEMVKAIWQDKTKVR